YKYDEPAYLNSKGRPTTVTDGSGTTHYAYTSLGQVSVVSKTIDYVTYIHSYNYDVGGRVFKMTYPDGSTVDYTFTDGGNLSAVALSGMNEATWFNYDAFGAPGNVYYGNGVSTTYTHDQMQHLTRVTTTQAGAPIQDLIFDWYYSIYPNVQTNGLALGNVLDN